MGYIEDLRARLYINGVKLKPFCRMLKDIIEEETLLPSSVGVYGDWGSGKSSLIRMSIKEFQEIEDIILVLHQNLSYLPMNKGY